jgi:hypothetical protein
MKEEHGKKLDPTDPAIPAKPDKPIALADEDLDKVAGGTAGTFGGVVGVGTTDAAGLMKAAARRTNPG